MPSFRKTGSCIWGEGADCEWLDCGVTQSTSPLTPQVCTHVAYSPAFGQRTVYKPSKGQKEAKGQNAQGLTSPRGGPPVAAGCSTYRQAHQRHLDPSPDTD